jgi:hypothetical protein
VAVKAWKKFLAGANDDAVASYVAIFSPVVFANEQGG